MPHQTKYNEHIELFSNCPDNKKHKNCPFKSFRKLNPEEKYVEWTKLSEQQILDCIQQHLHCSKCSK